jgi:hypothetical protein
MESDSEREETAGAVGDGDREKVDVGKKLALQKFDGTSEGHDVSWRGHAVTRSVALQPAGSTSRGAEWGRHWGEALKDLGADIGVLSETRISRQDTHAHAVNGLLAAGYIAVSHDVEADARRTTRPLDGQAADNCGPRGGGVIITVRSTYAGSWQAVGRGPHGRALAGIVVNANGVAISVLGFYGVTGACGLFFHTRSRAFAVEADVCEFVRRWATSILSRTRPWTGGTAESR